MRHLFGYSIVLLSTAAFAQSSASGVVALATPSSSGCPVGLSARHAADGGLVAVDRSSPSPDHAYRVSFEPSDARTIVQARITLRGLAGAQVMPAGNRPTANAAETFTVVPSARSPHLYDSLVYAGKLTGVQWIDLNEIRFSDGTQWRESATATCRIAPNGFMLVANGSSRLR